MRTITIMMGACAAAWNRAADARRRPAQIVAKWKNPSRERQTAMPHFAVLFGDRFMRDR